MKNDEITSNRLEATIAAMLTLELGHELPKWAKYVAMDKSECWFVYSKLPLCGKSIWGAGCVADADTTEKVAMFIGNNKQLHIPVTNWKQSLIEL